MVRCRQRAGRRTSGFDLDRDDALRSAKLDMVHCRARRRARKQRREGMQEDGSQPYEGRSVAHRHLV
jgi:uncharacterized protein YodC (DUF2158 family)